MKKIRHNEKAKVIETNVIPGYKSIDIESMFHVAMMDTFGLSSEQYDIFCEKVDEDELESVFLVFNGRDTSFSAKRKALEVINKYKTLTK